MGLLFILGVIVAVIVVINLVLRCALGSYRLPYEEEYDSLDMDDMYGFEGRLDDDE